MIGAVKMELAVIASKRNHVIVIGDDAAYDALPVKIQTAANSITAFAVLDDVNVIYLIQSWKSPPFRIPGEAYASQLSILAVIPYSHSSFPCLHDGFSVFICSSA